MIKDRLPRFYIIFFIFYNLVFGLISFIYPYDMAAFELDFDGRFSLYETLKEDDSQGVLNFSFVHGEYSAMMRMIAIFRFALSLGFISILINPAGKWPILLMGIVSNIGLLIIAISESKRDGFTGSGTDMSFIFNSLTLIFMLHLSRLLIAEEVIDEKTKVFFRGIFQK